MCGMQHFLGEEFLNVFLVITVSGRWARLKLKKYQQDSNQNKINFNFNTFRVLSFI